MKKQRSWTMTSELVHALVSFAAGYVAGIITLTALVMWYCKDGGQIIIKGEKDV